MIRKIIYLVVIFGAVLFLPWPLVLIAIIVLVLVVKSIYGAVAAALFFDWAYGAAGHLMVGLLTVVMVVTILFISRHFIRFDRLKNDY